jgi:hypothetical protein
LTVSGWPTSQSESGAEDDRVPGWTTASISSRSAQTAPSAGTRQRPRRCRIRGDPEELALYRVTAAFTNIRQSRRRPTPRARQPLSAGCGHVGRLKEMAGIGAEHARARARADLLLPRGESRRSSLGRPALRGYGDSRFRPRFLPMADVPFLRRGGAPTPAIAHARYRPPGEAGSSGSGSERAGGCDSPRLLAPVRSSPHPPPPGWNEQPLRLSPELRTPPGQEPSNARRGGDRPRARAWN